MNVFRSSEWRDCTLSSLAFISPYVAFVRTHSGTFDVRPQDWLIWRLEGKIYANNDSNNPEASTCSSYPVYGSTQNCEVDTIRIDEEQGVMRN